MNEKQVPIYLKREEAKYYILLTMSRFKAVVELLDDGKYEVKIPLAERRQLMLLTSELNERKFIKNLNKLDKSEVFEILSSRGLREFLLKCKELSDKFNLNVKIPSNITIVGEDVVEKFISELTEESLLRLRFNLEEVIKTKKMLLSQVENVNVNGENKNELEIILSKRQEYDIAKNNYFQAFDQIRKLSAMRCSNKEAYQRYSQIGKENKKVMDTILRDYPLVDFFNSRTDKNYLKKKINNIFSDICKAINEIIKKIRDGKYPIWHFDALIIELLQKYDVKDAEVIKEELKKMKMKDFIVDLSLTIGSITLSVLTLLIPGGAVASLLYAKTALIAVSGGVGFVSAVNDISDSLLYKQEALSHIKVNPEIKELMRAENIKLSEAQLQLLAALVSSAFVIFDAADLVKSFKSILKLEELYDVPANALRHSKRFGEKVLQNVDVAMINYIGKTEKAVKVLLRCPRLSIFSRIT